MFRQFELFFGTSPLLPSPNKLLPTRDVGNGPGAIAGDLPGHYREKHGRVTETRSFQRLASAFHKYQEAAGAVPTSSASYLSAYSSEGSGRRKAS